MVFCLYVSGFRQYYIIMNTRTSKILLILSLTLLAEIASASTFQQISYIAPKLSKPYRVALSYYIDESAREYGIDASLLTAILAKESMFRVNAVNYKTHDYGIGQLNDKTIKAYKFDRRRILTDLKYSIRCSAKVLSWFRRYNATEYKWFCRYNIGTKKFTIQNTKSCAKYSLAVQSYQFSELVVESK